MIRWYVSMVAMIMVLNSASVVQAQSYSLDPVHSSVVFRIMHNNVSYFYGRVNAPEGTVEFDPAQPEAASFTITLRTANIDTGNPQRDTHLKSAEYFGAVDNPTLTFKSTAVKKGEGNMLAVTGDITIRGVRKSITVPMEITGQVAAPRPLIGFETTFTIKRSEFGLTAGQNMLGDEVRLTVSFQGRR